MNTCLLLSSRGLEAFFSQDDLFPLANRGLKCRNFSVPTPNMAPLSHLMTKYGTLDVMHMS